MNWERKFSRRAFLQGGALVTLNGMLFRMTRDASAENNDETWFKLPLDILEGAYLVSDPEAINFGCTVENANFTLTQYIPVYPGLEVMLTGMNAANGRDGWVGYTDLDLPVVELWSNLSAENEGFSRKKIVTIPDGIWYIRGSAINQGLPPEVKVKNLSEYLARFCNVKPDLTGYTEVKELRINPHRRKSADAKFDSETDGIPAVGDVFFVPAGSDIMFTVKNANMIPVFYSGDNFNSTKLAAENVEKSIGFGISCYHSITKDICNWLGVCYYSPNGIVKNLPVEALQSAEPHLYIRFPGNAGNTKYVTLARTRGVSGHHKRLFTLVHLTDIHGDMDSAHAAFRYAEQIGADIIGLTGDYVPHGADHGFNILHSLICSSKTPVVYSIGNHDLKGTDDNTFKINIEPIRQSLRVNGNSPYYYRDFDYNGEIIRVISLYPFYENAKERKYGYYTRKQLMWFCEALSTAPENGHIFVLRHFSHHKPVSMGEERMMFYDFEDSTTEKGLNLWLNMDRDPIPEIIDAYKEKSIFESSYIGNLKEGTENISLSYNFSGRTDSEFVAYLTGHWHCDAIGYTRGNRTKQIVLNSICTTGVKGNEGYHSYTSIANPRDYGTDSQIAFNVFTFDFEKKKIYTARVGNGLRLGSEKTWMEIEYTE